MYQEPVSGPSSDGTSAERSPPATRNIFRAEALDHYLQNQQKIELPRLISTRLFRVLWLVSLLLMALGALIAFWPLILTLW